MSKVDPLSAVLVDADDVDRGLLAALVKDHVQVDRASGRLILKPAFTRLDPKGKILKTLLAVKARSLLSDVPDGALAKDVIEITGLPSGTVHPALRRLTEERIIAQMADKKYYVPGWSLASMAENDEEG